MLSSLNKGKMRKKELKLVVTFHTTADAMAMAVSYTHLDLVDEEWLELVEEEIKEELEGTFLEHAPVAKVSAATGQGIPELVETCLLYTSTISKKAIL